MSKELDHFQKIINKHEFVMNMNHDGLALVSPCGTMAMQSGKNCPYIVFDAVGIQREKVELVPITEDTIFKNGGIYVTDAGVYIFNNYYFYRFIDNNILAKYFPKNQLRYEVVRVKTEPGKPVY